MKGSIKFVQAERSAFFPTLKKRVEQYFRDNQIDHHANAQMVVKTIVLLTAYITPFVAMVVFDLPTWVNLICWTIMGLALAGIGMSVMHDANHGAYSANKKVNTLLGYTLNLAGASVFNWKLQHNILHHTYTNVVHYDEDIDDKGFMRFSPHTRRKKYQSLQVVYAFLFYAVITLYWVIAKDLLQFIRYTKNGVNPNKPKENVITFLKISAVKISYLFVTLFVPIYFAELPWLQVISGFLIMHGVAGLILTVIFQLAHTVEGTSHPLPNDSGNIENDWAIHQLNTTVNFSPDSKILTWYLGGLNHQVEHHLFPRICHVHYPAISKIVQETCNEFGVPYLENKTFMQALRSHIRTLKRFGRIDPELAQM